MPEIHFSAAALQDMRDIWDYVARDSEFQADRLIARIRAKLEYIAKWPSTGRPRPELSPDCRSYPMDKYCFYFRQIEDGIALIRLLHSSRDIQKQSFRD
jgi:toxin ParE1/3/4